MRFIRTTLVAGLVTGAVSGLAAQSTNTCAPAGAAPVPPALPTVAYATRDACIKAADIFTYMTPQLGNGLVGGNTTAGQGGSLGGFPHFALVVRATGAPDAKLPDFGSISINAGPEALTAIPTKSQAFGLAGVDAAVGLYGGYSVIGIGTFFGVDGLVSAVYVPDVNQGSAGSPGYFGVKAKDSYSIGYGARIGIFNGAALLPSVGASFMMRSLPKTTLTTQAATSSITIQDLTLNTTSWRLTASQSLVILGLNAGYGQDMFDGATDFTATVNPGNYVLPLTHTTAKTTRTNWFVGATVNLFIFKVFGEYGQQSGGNLVTYNPFGGSNTSVNDSKTYFSGGLRFGF
jgi:hypothetical protein